MTWALYSKVSPKQTEEVFYFFKLFISHVEMQVRPNDGNTLILLLGEKK
jgi:hypothetical protein